MVTGYLLCRTHMRAERKCNEPARLHQVRLIPCCASQLQTATFLPSCSYAYSLLQVSGIERSSPRPISTGQLKGLTPLTPPAYQPAGLAGVLPGFPVGDLILGWASHLDAFSAYPIRTWLPGGALGRTTGTLAVRPTRSSRTKVSSPQISCAHSGYDPNCLTTF